MRSAVVVVMVVAVAKCQEWFLCVAVKPVATHSTLPLPRSPLATRSSAGCPAVAATPPVLVVVDAVKPHTPYVLKLGSSSAERGSHKTTRGTKTALPKTLFK